jgi:predicted dithiol-disulfide oxidoreductase (DUF899 family)
MQHRIVTRDEWLAAHRQHLVKEKELTRQRDRLSADRRALPWREVDKTYVFDGPHGRETLAGLFDGRSQLIVQHFMFGPGWAEGCTGCSFMADHVDGARVHLENHDVTFVAVSRAPLAELDAYRNRMGWHFKWVSSFGSDFNYDYHVSFTKENEATGKVLYNYEMQDYGMDELPGISVFYKDEAGRVFHTFSAFGRGGEPLIGTYNFLDYMPKGRNETGPNFNLRDWVRRHDQYEHDAEKASCCA